MRAQKRQKKSGVYAGSFDPLTVGHLWMIEQGVGLFHRLIVAVGINPEKRYAFSLEDRLAMLRESLRTFQNVSVSSFSNRCGSQHSWPGRKAICRIRGTDSAG